jgi:hypothetical protein
LIRGAVAQQIKLMRVELSAERRRRQHRQRYHPMRRQRQSHRWFRAIPSNPSIPLSPRNCSRPRRNRCDSCANLTSNPRRSQTKRKLRWRMMSKVYCDVVCCRRRNFP